MSGHTFYHTNFCMTCGISVDLNVESTPVSCWRTWPRWMTRCCQWCNYLVGYKTYKRSHDEDDDESFGDIRGRVDITIAHSWHSDQKPVETLPVGQVLAVGVVIERIPRILCLYNIQNIFYTERESKLEPTTWTKPDADSQTAMKKLTTWTIRMDDRCLRRPTNWRISAVCIKWRTLKQRNAVMRKMERIGQRSNVK